MLNRKIQARKTKGLANLALMTAIAVPAVTVSFFTAPFAIAQSTRKAVVFDPPSNVRAYPNGQIICSVRSASSINVYGYNNGWYKTDYCGQGYIHQSQVRLQPQSQAKHSKSFCDVINISQGQLALRFTPDGESRAGLNNGNTVRPLQQQGIWSYVRVFDGPNSQVNGLEGWVNSNYLTCYDLNRVSQQQHSSTSAESAVTRRQAANTNTSQTWQNAKLIRVLEKRSINGKLVPINSIAFAPDGQTLVSGDKNDQIKIWNLSTGEVMEQKIFYAADPKSYGRPYGVKKVAISPDGRFLVSSAVGMIEVLNLNTGDLQYRLSNGVNKFVISPDGQTLISGNSDDKSVRLWNMSSGELKRKLSGEVERNIALSISQDGSLIAVSSQYGKIQIWSSQTGELIREFNADRLNPLATTIAPDNQILFTSFDSSSTVEMWNIQTGEVIRSFNGHSDVVTSIAISPDGQTLATGSKDGTIRIMDLRTRELIRVLKDAGKIQSVSFSPDSRTIASSSEDGKIMVWQKP